MARYAMVINLKTCIRCYSCVVGCLRENTVRRTTLDVDGQQVPYYIECDGLAKVSRTRITKFIAGSYPNVKAVTFFEQCQHCENAPCVKVCPTGASYKTDDGTVLVDPEKCIKCKYCISACPYGARTFPEDGKHLNGYALSGKYGTHFEIPDKCSFCYHRNSGNGPWEPACVELCPTGSRIFGDLDDPNSEVRKLVDSGVAIQYMPEYGTGPKIYYILPENVKPEPKTRDTTAIEIEDSLKPLKKLALVGAGAVGLAALANGIISAKKEETKEEGIE